MERRKGVAKSKMLFSRQRIRLALPWRHCFLAVLGAIFFLAGPVRAADQKLVLTDGSDHLVRSYERKGDRVRYFSTERQQWEEIPAEFVDWEATEEAKREMEKIPEVALEPAPGSPAAARFTVAPGIALPESEGVYVYSGNDLNRLEQSQATVTKDRKRSILRAIIPIPAIKARSWVELEGPTAKIAISGSSPVFYVQFKQSSPAGFGLLRLEQKKDSRIVGEILVNPVTQKVSHSPSLVLSEIQAALPGSVDGGPPIIRLSPSEPLGEGEYAVVEFVEVGTLNLFVWDFSYHPSPEVRLPSEGQPNAASDPL